ncbi:MAG: matrixin family metalloprotease [Bdellovibrionaceae bacterium]|nr:matrixin family metalloprotease [Pseudobdellovibrionaceae bacterium]
MNRILKLSVWIFILFLSLGFRVSSGKWAISKSDPTLWIKLCNASLTIEENDIREADPLMGLNDLTYAQVIQSVIDDYNNIPTSYLRLALYPADPNNPGTPAAGDSVFTVDKAKNRTIEICFGETDAAAGVSGGYAKPNVQGGEFVTCEIRARPEHAKKVRFMVHLLTHELGHCLSLQHPQEATHSVMSYFTNDSPFLRLQNDDYAGITFRYPKDELYGKEDPTFGLKGCSPK